MTITYLHEVFLREFAPVVQARCLDSSVIPDVGQEFLELLVRALFLLQGLYPQLADEVIAHNYGMSSTPALLGVLLDDQLDAKVPFAEGASVSG